jgi:hypothetical protein
MRRTFRLAIAAATALAATVTMAPAAEADTAIRHERRGDAPRHIDLTKVTIDNGDTQPRLAIIRVRVAGTLRAGPHDGDVISIWLDRDRDPRPDLKLDYLYEWEWEWSRVHRWNGHAGWAECGPIKLAPFREGHGLTFKVARSCLNNHPVRVAVRTATIDDNERVQDWFRGRRTFLAGVRR